MVPMVAVDAPRITVFFSASWVEDNSVNTNTTLCRVMVDGVTRVVAFGENAAFSSAKYGRNTGLSSTTRQNASAAQRHPFISIGRGAPYLPPTTEKPRRPSRNFWPCSSNIVSGSGGRQLELWRILEQAPDFRRHGVEAGRQRQDRGRTEQRHRLQERDQRAG